MISHPAAAPIHQEPAAALAALVDSRAPFLIGVRHHSAALAASMEELLDGFAPDAMLIELPAQAQDWLPWLSSPDTVAPLAFAGAGANGYLAFYPFADFSPELVALRWARAHNVPVLCADAPMGSEPLPSPEMPDAGPLTQVPEPASSYAASLVGRTSASRDELWEAHVEAPGAGAGAEAIRVAGLGIGWAHRADELASSGLSPRDAYREAIMRNCLHAALQEHRKVAAVVGSFHAAALLEEPGEVPAALPAPEISCSLVPYEFSHLDSRSGYPSGVKDPAWQQGVWESRLDVTALREHTITTATQVARELREIGHPTGPAEVREAVRLSLDLAALRGNHAAGRRELHEGFASVFAQGDVLGKGRAVARAAQKVLVGQRRGKIDPLAPRSGLVVSLTETMAAARLPFGPDLMRTPKIYDLDPLRGTATGKEGLDRTRQLVLARLGVAGILYASAQDVASSFGPALTHRWKVQYVAGTVATVEHAALRGVTLHQAAEGALLASLSRQVREQGPTPAQITDGLNRAAGANLATPFAKYLSAAEDSFLQQASLAELLTLHELLQQLSAGHFAVFSPQEWQARMNKLTRLVLAAALAQVEGLRGSKDPAAAASLGRLFRQLPTQPLRLIATIGSFKEQASPLIQGSAWGILTISGHCPEEDLAQELSGWIVGAHSSEQRDKLGQRLAGLWLCAGSLLESGNAVMSGLIATLEALSDEAFVARVPALRGGFDVLSPADRQRALDSVRSHTGASVDNSPVEPQLLLAWATADQQAWAALEASGLRHGITAANRWRLVLGREQQDLDGPGRRYARSLDELYGHGSGEGSETDRMGRGGGNDDSFPSARVWGSELETLFGSEVREEVLAHAVARGRADALGEVRPDAVVPSVELLGNVLNLVGALPESQLGPARALVRRIVEQLARELANELRPTLHGIAGVRTTRRKTPRIDLPATIRANLATARPRTLQQPGKEAVAGWQLVPSSPVFKTLTSKSSTWDVIVLVDVSGSMEQSVIFAALTSAILAGSPALQVHFVAFSTKVLDLSEHVTDPLALLLEVAIGGGTDIGAAMAYARTLVRRPQKTLLAVVSDFEEGASVPRLVSECADLAASGVHMMGCAALDRSGNGSYNVSIASQLVAAGMPIAAVTPQGLTAWVAEVLKRHA